MKSLILTLSIVKKPVIKYKPSNVPRVRVVLDAYAETMKRKK